MATERKKNGFENGPDAQMIRDLARLLDETGLSEIELEREGLRLRVARNLHVHASASPAALPRASEAVAAPAAETAADLSAHPGGVKSPMVGTVYIAPEPGAAHFVKLGDTVTKGQTLLLVEAMKTMNPIPAHKAGKIARILVENEAPVEYGQVLMIIE